MDSTIIDVTMLQKNIEDLSIHLKNEQIDDDFASRLDFILTELQSDRFKYLGFNYDSSIDISLLIENAKAAYTKRVWWVGLLELVRNILVLIPILLTWFALSRASAAYLVVTQNNQALLEVPFLLQWEQNFSGQLPTLLGQPLTFSHVAMWDAGIILLVVILTSIVIWVGNIQTEKAERKALKLASSVNGTLSQVRLYEAIRNASIPDTSEKRSLTLLESIYLFVDEFKQKSQNLTQVIELEKRRLEEITQQREIEYQNLKTATDGLRQTTDTYAHFGNEISNQLSGINSAISTFTGEAKKLGEIQNQLLSSLQQTDSRFEKFDNSINKIDQNQSTYVNALVSESNSAVAKSAELIEATKILSATTRTLVNEQSDFRTVMEDQKLFNDKWIKDLSEGLEKIIQAAGRIENLQRAFETSITQFATSAKEVGGLTSTNEDMKKITTEFIQHIQLVGTQIVELERNIQNFLKVNSDVAAYMQTTANQLTQLRAPIQGLAGHLQSAENGVKQASESNQLIIKQTAALAEEIRQLNNTIRLGQSSGVKNGHKSTGIIDRILGR